jgi:threonine/homoserine/homoserine lactone efflux protein
MSGGASDLPSGEDVKYWIFLLVHYPMSTVPLSLGIAIAMGTSALSRRKRSLLAESKFLRTVAYVFAAILAVFGAYILVLVFGGCC